MARGAVIVALCGNTVAGVVGAAPGEVTRLFLPPKAAGRGLGIRLLEIGLGGDPITIGHMEAVAPPAPPVPPRS